GFTSDLGSLKPDNVGTVSNKATEKALISEDGATTNESSMWKMTLFKAETVIFARITDVVLFAWAVSNKANEKALISEDEATTNESSMWKMTLFKNHHRVHTYRKMYTGSSAVA
nr:hypothetical protein [Tanacetum cinerariifolium]